MQVIARDDIVEIRAFGFRKAFTCVRAVATELRGEYCTSRACKIYCCRHNHTDYRSYRTLQLLLCQLVTWRFSFHEKVIPSAIIEPNLS